MLKLDPKKEFSQLYNPPKNKFTMIDVPPLSFLMIDGQGNPNTSPAYRETVEALYALAYALKFSLKPQGVEFVVAPQEGLWWEEDMAKFSAERKDYWQWTMMIMQPEQVNQELFARVSAETMRKKNLPAISKARLETYHEGLAAQIMYFGAYVDEGPTIARMHAWIDEQGYLRDGKHHEIYLSDPRKTAPEKLKTVIRQPVRKKA